MSEVDVMKRTAKDWFKVLILLLDEVVVVAVVLAILWYFDIKLPLWVAILGALLLGLLAFVTHKVIVPSFHVRQVTGREGMIGMEAEVVETLNPTGVIRVEGDLWKAKSVEDEIPNGETVEIQSVKRLVVEVRRKGC